MVQATPSSASSIEQIPALVEQQRQFFASGRTKDVAFRLQQLKTLRQALLDHEAPLLEALHADLGKPQFEAYLFELGAVQEIDHAIKHLKQWAKPQSVALSMTLKPGKAWIQPEPLGVVLIIAPWNYPVQLMVSPLVGAIAAGNCAVLKPSEIAPHTSRVLSQLIQKTFDPAYIAAIEGGVEVSQAVLAERFDHIFFTGGTAIGKIVMTAAAKHLTPVTLELGGKSPCIVDTDIDLDCTARRIVWGKFINSGQTCIAPDYLLVDRRIKPALLEAMQTTLQSFYGADPAQSPDYGRIVSDRQFNRLAGLLNDTQGQILVGGQTNPTDRYIAPTLIDAVTETDATMREELFGPILPVLDYDEVQQAIELINRRPKPLALYIFSRDRQLQQRILHHTSSGGVCINDTVMQVGAATLPFGGVGESGIGAYHGKSSFDTFSHQKAVLAKPFWLDLKLRYAPYGDKLKLLKRLF